MMHVGGGINQPKNIDTIRYKEFLRGADANKDGKITREEAQKHYDELMSIQTLVYDPVKEDQLTAGRNMLKYFDRFAIPRNPDGMYTTAVPSAEDKATITEAEAQHVAEADGDASTVSAYDMTLMKLEPSPVPSKPSSTIETSQYQSFLKQADANKDGKLTRQEVQNHYNFVKSIRMPGYDLAIAVGKNMLTHFDRFAVPRNPDGIYADVVPSAEDKATITAAEIQHVAEADGDATRISHYDLTLKNVSPSRPKPQPPEFPGPQMDMRQMLMMMLFKLFERFFSRSGF